MSEPVPPTPSLSEAEELREQCAALRWQMTTLLLALIVVSGTLTVYLGVLARRAGGDLREIRPQALQVIDQYRLVEPGINDLVAKLAEYGRTHPDFAPILNKYNVPVAAPPATVAPKPASTSKK